MELQEINQKLNETRDELFGILTGLSEDQLNKKTDSNSWSISQICQHLFKTEELYVVAIKKGLKSNEDSIIENKPVEFLLDRSKKLEAPDIAKPTDEFLEYQEIIEKLNNSRQKLHELLNTVDPSVLGKRHFTHPVFKEMRLIDWVKSLYLHEQRHIKQINEILDKHNESSWTSYRRNYISPREAALKVKQWPKDTIAAGRRHTVGLKTDRTVAAVGDNKYGQCEVSGWRDIVAVAAGNVHMATNTGNAHTIGLKSDGTVEAVGWNKHDQCNVNDWRDIVAVAAGWCRTIGLKSDGTVVAVGRNNEGECNVSDWHNIVAIAAGDWHTIGLKLDGTVTAVGNNRYNQCKVSGWNDIVAVTAGYLHTIGLKSDGTVTAVGLNKNDQCDVSEWRGIVAIAAGSHHTIGLKSDGTVAAAGWNEYGQCNVSNWRNIVAIAAGCAHTVGLKSDGTVVAVGDNEYGQCDASGWYGIQLPELGD